MAGRVYLVGAGPGAADLLTVRAVRLLATADIVLHDALVSEEVLAIAARATLIDVGKRAGKHSTAQRFINRRLVAAAGQHAVVVRLKGGDPMLFGRAQEEIDALRLAGIEVEVVPGITAALAAAAQTGVSLTARGVSRSVTIATPATGDGERANDWTSAATSSDTLVLYMAARNARQHAAALLDGGKRGDTAALYVESTGTPDAREQVTTLRGIADGELDRVQRAGPGLLIIGAVAAHYRDKTTNPETHGIPTPRAINDHDTRLSRYRQIHR